jgi:thiopeptide-type bacteriocin biosynthesis protein
MTARDDPHAARYEPLGYAVLRAPLLSMGEYRAFSRAAPDARLAEAARRADIRDALAVGAPDLLEAIDRAPAGRRRARLDASLLRYLIRMSSRPTPYGLFAGVALATWSDVTDLRLANAPRRMRARLDMGWLARWIDALEQRPEIRRALRLVANPAAFERAGRLYLAERPSVGDAPPAGEVSVRCTATVRRCLTLARCATPYDTIAAALGDSAARPTRERVETLIDSLCAQGFLLTELRPPLTTAAPAEHVLRALAATPPAVHAAEQLRRLVGDARAAAERPAARPMRPAREEPADDESPTDDPRHQVDSALVLRRDRVSHRVAADAARAAELLVRLSPYPDGPPHLAAYRREHVARYGPRRLVPLLELVDPERGLGPLDAVASTPERPDAARRAQRDQTLLELAARAAHDRHLSIDLDDRTIARLEIAPLRTPRLPATLDLNLLVGARSVRHLDAGDFTVVVGPNVGAMEAGRGLGRFADLLGQPACDALRADAAFQDDAPAAIDAELVYAPRQARSANVAVRPALHAYEIVMGAAPSVAPDHVIPLDDLAIGVEGDRLVAWWVSRGCRVRVHAGHMLNSMTAPAACRLLAELDQDAVMPLMGFDWGPAERLPFLPRVRAGRVVLRAAQWRIDAIDAGWQASAPPADLTPVIARWRTRWKMPRYVHVGSADNRLLIDLRAAEHHAALRDALPEAGFVVQEALPVPREHWLRGPGGSFASELVVPLVRRDVKARPAADAADHSAARGVAIPSPARLRPPGSDWLFAKLYCPRSAQDDVLVNDVGPLCEQLTASDAADRWFFVRYADDASHLRIRFHGASERLTRIVMPELCTLGARLIAERCCDRLTFDTYDREIERYGGEQGVAMAEEVFAADSRATLGMLGLLARRALSIDRIALGIVSIDRLLAGLGLDDDARLRHYGRMRDAKHLVGGQYRTRKRELCALLSDERLLSSRPGGAELLALLAARDEALAPIVERLRTFEFADGDLLEEWFANVVHLHCNRLLGGAPEVEASALGLLLRTREGLRAMARSRIPVMSS